MLSVYCNVHTLLYSHSLQLHFLSFYKLLQNYQYLMIY